jgi:hypothetical protein
VLPPICQRVRMVPQQDRPVSAAGHRVADRPDARVPRRRYLTAGDVGREWFAGPGVEGHSVCVGDRDTDGGGTHRCRERRRRAPETPASSRVEGLGCGLIRSSIGEPLYIRR